MERSSAHLQLIHSTPLLDGGPKITVFRPGAGETAEQAGHSRFVGSRQALLERLACVGELGPTAPLSFVVIQVSGVEARGDVDSATARTALQAVARRVHELTRAIDFIGRIAPTTFGVVLQGTGATAAAAVAARIQFHLDRLPEASTPIAVVVSVATGSGVNAETLPVAALDAVAATPA